MPDRRRPVVPRAALSGDGRPGGMLASRGAVHLAKALDSRAGRQARLASAGGRPARPRCRQLLPVTRADLADLDAGGLWLPGQGAVGMPGEPRHDPWPRHAPRLPRLPRVSQSLAREASHSASSSSTVFPVNSFHASGLYLPSRRRWLSLRTSSLSYFRETKSRKVAVVR
jgi:hypothetical protein